MYENANTRLDSAFGPFVKENTNTLPNLKLSKSDLAKGPLVDSTVLKEI
jgi:hypothetical protein